MKQKIKVMKEKPALSDDEIRSYMDFDRLVAKAKTHPSPDKFQGLWKRVVPAAAISGALVWFIFFANESKKPDKKPDPEAAGISATETRNDKETVPTVTVEPDVTSPKKETSPVSTPEGGKKVTKNPVPSYSGQTKEVYVQAEPVDGYPALYEYFNANLTYPQEAIKDSVEGVLTVSFQINAGGKPGNIQVKQSLGVPFEKEAVRLIENMPSWKPATLNGKPVPSQISLPLTFQLRKAITKE